MITIHQRHRQTDRQTDRETTCDRKRQIRNSDVAAISLSTNSWHCLFLSYLSLICAQFKSATDLSCLSIICPASNGEQAIARVNNIFRLKVGRLEFDTFYRIAKSSTSPHLPSLYLCKFGRNARPILKKDFSSPWLRQCVNHVPLVYNAPCIN